MPPSQLKRLKASLREQGIVGPQKSKKQKKQNAQNGANNEKRIHRTEALNAIRDQFNPFEYRWSKGPKFEATSMKGSNSTKGGIIGRSHVGKTKAEDNNISYSMANRRKVGGIVDKRFGENDPTMDPEEKMLQRLTRVAERRSKQSMFDLDDDEPGLLTHMGQSLSLDGPAIDDFDEADLSDEEDGPSNPRKRGREVEDDSFENEENENEEDMPERKKSKQERMHEIIAKSKNYKQERQAAKDEDDDIREALDKELSGIHELLRGIKPQPPSTIDIAGMDPDRAALLAGEKTKADKEYDLRLKQLAQDARSKPTERMKTDEEIAAEAARLLKEREAKRLKEQERQERKLRGLRDDDDEDADLDAEEPGSDENEGNFGLGSGIQGPKINYGVEDEDDFIIDDDLLADSGLEDEDESNIGTDADESGADEEEEADFIKDLLTEEESKRPEFLTGANAPLLEVQLPEKNGVDGNLAYTFECPQTHDELLSIASGINVLDLPTVVQRIRLQYDAKLKAENKSKLGKFAVTLVDHISYQANQPEPAPNSVIETLIRHIHSLAKTGHALEIGKAFVCHLSDIHENRHKDLNVGDLVLLTAIGTIFNTADHFHDIVVPAMLTMDRYLGLKVPYDIPDYATGAYLSTLCLQYMQKSERYVPSVMSFIENTLCVLAPAPLTPLPGHFPYHEPKVPMRINGASATSRSIALSDCKPRDNFSDEEYATLKLALLEINLKLLHTALQTWGKKSAVLEIFEPVLRIVEHYGSKKCRTKLPPSTQESITKLASTINTSLSTARLARRPLELHHHRPLAIKMAIPKFEESYNPNKHYDPDRDRTESAKLKKELKRERKGAVRELRKDARAIAAESLKQKRERDAAYDKKYKRLIAEIQGEEGREAKAYEREKEWRKKGRK